jgi:hypothetical protein
MSAGERPGISRPILWHSHDFVQSSSALVALTNAYEKVPPWHEPKVRVTIRGAAVIGRRDRTQAAVGLQAVDTVVAGAADEQT